MIARMIILITAPIFLVVVFIIELWNETKKAPWYAWNTCMQSMDEIKRAWRSKSLDPENWK